MTNRRQGQGQGHVTHFKLSLERLKLESKFCMQVRYIIFGTVLYDTSLATSAEKSVNKQTNKLYVRSKADEMASLI